MRAYDILLKDYVDNDPRPLNQSTRLRMGGIDPLSIFATMWHRIWRDDGIRIEEGEGRVKLLSHLSALGTEIFVRSFIDDPPMTQATYASQVTMMHITMAAILFIENGANGRGLQPKIRDIMSDRGGCTMAKILSKRTPCSCVEEIMVFLEPKGGTCYHCGVSKPAKEFMLCSRCRVTQYCSKSCQKAHWPEHKHYCSEQGYGYRNLISSRREYFTSIPVPAVEGSSFASSHNPLS
jgi:hypothetical protein